MDKNLENKSKFKGNNRIDKKKRLEKSKCFFRAQKGESDEQVQKVDRID